MQTSAPTGCLRALRNTRPCCALPGVAGMGCSDQALAQERQMPPCSTPTWRYRTRRQMGEERATGLEPATTCLEGRGSTTELHPQSRGERTRTSDPSVPNAVRYQLRYTPKRRYYSRIGLRVNSDIPGVMASRRSGLAVEVDALPGHTQGDTHHIVRVNQAHPASDGTNTVHNAVVHVEQTGSLDG